jgi:hypothetical protein
MADFESYLGSLASGLIDELSARVRSGLADGLRVVADDVFAMEREFDLGHALYAVGIGVYHQLFVCPVVGVRETVGGHWHGFIVNDGAWVRALMELERYCRDMESSPAKVQSRLENYLFGCYRSGRRTPTGDFERGGRLLWIRVNGSVGRVNVCWVSMSRRLPETEQDYYRDVEFPVPFVVVPSLELREWGRVSRWG